MSPQVVGVLAPNDIVGQAGAATLLLVLMLQNGYIVAAADVQPPWRWAYWLNPLQHGLTSLALIEFHSARYAQPRDAANAGLGTVGDYFLALKKMPTDDHRLATGCLFNAGWYLLMTALHSLVLVYLRWHERFPAPPRPAPDGPGIVVTPATPMPFRPCTLAWAGVCCDVAAPGARGGAGLRVLSHVSGFARPGTLTALMGSSGAGKTTLLDVLAGRKTTGRVEVPAVPSSSTPGPWGGARAVCCGCARAAGILSTHVARKSAMKRSRFLWHITTFPCTQS